MLQDVADASSQSRLGTLLIAGLQQSAGASGAGCIKLCLTVYRVGYGPNNRR